jgi:PAS domain S-box-containing protein
MTEITSDLPFLTGGEAGNRMRVLDWSTTNLGLPVAWPSSLKSAVGIILRADVPMMVLWGEHYICLCNDAFLSNVAATDIPLGQAADAALLEAWSTSRAQLRNVLTLGRPYTVRDKQLTSIVQGQTTTTHWTFSYSQLMTDDGLPGGVLLTCMQATYVATPAPDPTSALQPATSASNVSLRVYETVVSATPDLVYVFDLNYRFTYANRALLTMWGKTWGTAIGKGLRENGYEEWHAAMHEREIDHVAATGESVRGEVSFPHAILGRRVYDYILVPVFNEKGEVEAVAGTTRDVSEMKQSELSLRESESRFRTLVKTAPVAMAMFRGNSYVAEIANDAYLNLIGKNEAEFLDRPLFESLPSVRPRIEEILKNVMTTGQLYNGNEFKVVLNRGGKDEVCYVNFTYSPLFGSGELPEGFMVVANEVTEQVNARHRVEESEARFRTMAESSPVFIAVGDETGDATYFNKAWLELTGRPMEYLLKYGWADLVHPDDREPYIKIYLDALKIKGLFTGEFRVRNNENEYRWLLAHGAPRFNRDGSFAGYISGCTDITRQKEVQLELEKKELALASAIELAELGTWTYDAVTGEVTLSSKHADMYGIRELQNSLDDYFSVIAEQDCDEVKEKFRDATARGSDGRYNAEYRIVNPVTNKTQMIHALGQAYFDDTGALTRVEGTAQDVTAQREVQLALENEVHARTIELAATNEELQAANEELLSINEELSESSRRLIQSNEELSQFAYVASHDLQEPVRKISVFVEMLYRNLPQLDERSKSLLEKIDASANRMLNLIRDVLKHSQILNNATKYERVDLNKVVRDVEKEFDMLIEQRSGTVVVDSLPVIDAIEFQMNQLFSNLISNAIKFSAPTRPLQVKITAGILNESEKLENQELNNRLTYYKISFQDNGIGFDQAHAYQIFEIFRRLHARSEYSGTGIGLATCKKIVQNHGGEISASSVPGEGATFHVIIPATQS